MLNFGRSNFSISKCLEYNLEGKQVYTITMLSEHITVKCTNLGCSILSVYSPASNGEIKNIVAGFPNIRDYEHNRDYFGCVLGRYANRIEGGSFYLAGKKIRLSLNDGTNHLHGGLEGFNQKVWEITKLSEHHDEVSVTFKYVSLDGEEGYPGNLQVQVKYTLNSHNQFCLEYTAHCDKATPISLSNHTYFNLTGFDIPVVTDHILQIYSSAITEKNEKNVPNGNILNIDGTLLDFRRARPIGDHIYHLSVDKGYDHNYVLKRFSNRDVLLAAELMEPSTGRMVKVYTDQPGLQLYTANYWDNTIYGAQGICYRMHGAVALETQAFPNSPNLASFPNTILYPGEQYFSKTIYEFGIY